MEYSLINYGIEMLPHWVKFDSTKRQLQLSTPKVESETTYKFGIKTVSPNQEFEAMRTWIELQVLPCQVSN